MSEHKRPWDWNRIEEGLSRAAGFESNPCVSLLVVGPIIELIHFGYSFEDDILPSIRRQAEALCGKDRETIRSWKHFIPGIIRDRADREYATNIINQSISGCLFLLTGNPCANCKTNQKNSGLSTKPSLKYAA